MLTNNPLKLEALKSAGIDADRIPLKVIPNLENQEYLRAKAGKLGHLI